MKGLAKAQKVHMGVIKSGTDETSFQINAPVILSCSREDIFVTADAIKKSVRHRKRFLQRQFSGVYLAVIIYCPHNTFFTLFLICCKRHALY